MLQSPPLHSVLLNVCILPDKKVASECIQMSQSLPSENVLFALDGKKRFTHMTVFMARFPEHVIERVLQETEEVLKTVQSFPCEQSGFFITAGNYLEVSYKRSEVMVYLQDLLIRSLKGFRYNPENPYEESYFAPYNKSQKLSALDTGYDLTGELYRPHITLTRYKEGNVPSKIPEFSEVSLSFETNTIALYKADENGAVYELLKEFKIQ
jgi:hypothetical protein